MSLYSRLKLQTRAFTNETDGNMAVEGLFAAILLLWWYVASFQFFDAFRQKNINQKAAYTIADMISRQNGAVDANYIEGLHTLFDYLTFSNKPTWIRVSSVTWDATMNRYDVAWSYASGASQGHSDASILDQAGRIPTMPQGDFVIIVETNMAYEPIFNIGLDANWYRTFIPTRPRFVPCVPFDKADGSLVACMYDNSIDPDGEVHDDGIPVIVAGDDDGDDGMGGS